MDFSVRCDGDDGADGAKCFLAEPMRRCPCTRLPSASSSDAQLSTQTPAPAAAPRRARAATRSLEVPDVCVCGDRTIARTSEVHPCAAESPVSPADVKGSTAVRPNRGDGHRMLPTRVRRFSRQSGTTVMSAAPTSPSTITSGRRSGRQRNHLAASRSPVPRLPTPQRLRPPR